MRRITATLAVLCGWIALMASFPQESAAQRTSSYGRRPSRGLRINRQATRPRLHGNKGPSISPYLNLLDSPNRIGFQYFGRVRPERELRARENALRRSFQDFESQYRRREHEAQLQSELLPTGFTASFMTHGKYFGAGQPLR